MKRAEVKADDDEEEDLAGEEANVGSGIMPALKGLFANVRTRTVALGV